jgi:hypothetical protein
MTKECIRTAHELDDAGVLHLPGSVAKCVHRAYMLIQAQEGGWEVREPADDMPALPFTLARGCSVSQLS